MDRQTHGRTMVDNVFSRMVISSFEAEAKQLNTRLPSNIRPTTRECVHLVTRGNFRSRDKDGSHTIRSAI